MEAAAPSITVIGGSGFVGSKVCEALVARGVSVRSVSKSGKVPEWCAGQAWTQSVMWIANDLCRGPREDLEAAVGAPEAMVSCVGTVGFDMQGLLLGNGKANAEAASAAKKTGTVAKYVFVSVASEVADCEGSWLPGWLGGYFTGKRQAEEAIVDAVGAESACFIRPSFIYGGDAFGLFPPRVAAGYGSAVEEALSFGPVQKLADLLPGLLKVALRPPVSVDAVAAACVAAALGEVADQQLDGTPSINAAARQPPATGLSDFTAAVKAKLDELVKSE